MTAVPQFYRIDGRRLTFREYRRMCPNLLVFLVAAGLKALGGAVKITGIIPGIDRLHEVSWDALPADDRDRLAGPAREWERLGFRRLFVHRLPLAQEDRLAAAVVFLAPTGDSFVQVWRFVRPDARFTASSVISYFPDGSFGVTTEQPHTFDDPPNYLRVQVRKLAPAAMWERHRENLAGPWAAEGQYPEQLTEARVRELVVRIEQEELEFHTRRGVLVPILDEDELEELLERGR